MTPDNRARVVKVVADEVGATAAKLGRLADLALASGNLEDDQVDVVVRLIDSLQVNSSKLLELKGDGQFQKRRRRLI